MLLNNIWVRNTQLWLEASHPRMLLIYAYCKGRSCKTLFLQWREYFVGITSSEVAAVLRKWRTESQRTILRAGRIIDLSSTVHPNPIQPNPLNISPPPSPPSRVCHDNSCCWLENTSDDHLNEQQALVRPLVFFLFHVFTLGDIL